MPKQIIRASRGKIIKTLHKIIRETDPKLLSDSAGFFDYVVEKGINGARILNNHEKKFRGIRGRSERTCLPYIQSTGVVGDPFILDWFPYIDEDILCPNRYNSKGRGFSGKRWGSNIESTSKVNKEIDASYTREENLIRPERSNLTKLI